MRHCFNCGFKLDEGSQFCSNCGTRIPALPPTPPVVPAQPEVQPQPAADNGQSQRGFGMSPERQAELDAEHQALLAKARAESALRKKKLRKRLTRVGIVLASVAALVIAGVGIYKANHITRADHPAAFTIVDQAAYDQDVAGQCSNLTEIYTSTVSLKQLSDGAKLAHKVAGFSDRKALKYIDDVNAYQSYASSYDSAIAQISNALVATETAAVARASKVEAGDVNYFVGLWSKPMLAEALNVCELSDKLDKVKTLTEAYAADQATAQSLADSAPWYPVGYTEWSTGDIAWKWVDNLGCDYYSCWHIKVIANTGCYGGVYAELSMLDSADNVVDYTNDTLPMLGAGDTGIMQFDDYNESADSGRITKISCY